jgi:hypothetical protein
VSSWLGSFADWFARRVLELVLHNQGTLTGCLLVLLLARFLWRRRSAPIRMVAVIMCLVAVAGLLHGPVAAGPRTLNWAGLGDSYSAGTGQAGGTLGGGGSCERSRTAYDYVAARLLDAEGTRVSLTHVACVGAVTGNFYARQGLGRGASVPPQFNSLSRSTDLVSLTMGGNDLGFGDEVVACIKGRCRPDLLNGQTAAIKNPQPNDRKGSAWDVLYGRLVGSYVDIRKHMNAAGQLFVLSYPLPFARPQDWKKKTCNGSIQSDEAAAANLFVSRLGDTIYQAVRGADLQLAREGRAGNVHFVDWRTPQRAYDRYVGATVLYNPDGLCGKGTPMIHGFDLSLPFTWVNTYHPTTYGYDVAARRLASAVEAVENR